MRTYIVPYMYIDGVPTFKNSYIMGMFDKMERDGTIEMVFFDGAVNTREEFLAFVRRPGIQLYELGLKDSDTPAGFIWLEMFTRRTALLHFCIFSEHWRGAYKIGHEVLVTLLSLRDSCGNYILDAVYGITPANNELALGAVRATGVNEVGTIPNAFYYESLGKSVDGVISYFTRRDIPEEELYEDLY